MTVFHFTCADHGYPGINRAGVVIPNWHPILGVSLAWFTTEAEPDRERCGLGMHITRCDRMAYRFRVADGLTTEWVGSWVRRQTPTDVLDGLETYGDPEHWHISTVPVPAILDIAYRYDVSA